MKILSNHISPLLTTLLLIVLCQSCVIYHKKPSTLEEAANPKNKKTMITTKDGEKYRLNWLDIEEEFISSTLKTEKEILAIDKISYILPKGDSRSIKLDSAAHLRGDFIIKTKNNESHYFELERIGDLIIATKKTGIDTVTVHIPKEQITRVQVKNSADSAVGSVLIFFIGIPVVVFTVLYVIVMTSP